MGRQPTPDVSAADVDRVVRRDYPRWVGEAAAILMAYGNEAGEREVARVRLAVLKLADGDIERLRSGVEVAKADYRDVIAFAEYPGFMKLDPMRLLPGDKQAVIDADWKQYVEWLER